MLTTHSFFYSSGEQELYDNWSFDDIVYLFLELNLTGICTDFKEWNSIFLEKCWLLI